jgi:hypothetical protein
VSGGFPVRSTATGVRFDVRLTPRASRTEIAGVRDGRLVVRVTAPPVDRAANDALVETIADALDVPRRTVLIVAGLTSRQKTIEVRGTTEAAVRERWG